MMRIDHAHAAIFINVITTEKQVAHFKTELPLGMAWGVPDFQCLIAYLDFITFV